MRVYWGGCAVDDIGGVFSKEGVREGGGRMWEREGRGVGEEGKGRREEGGRESGGGGREVEEGEGGLGVG